MRWGEGIDTQKLPEMLVALAFLIHKFQVGLDLMSQTFHKLLEKKSPRTCILLAGFANNGEDTGFAQDLIFV